MSQVLTALVEIFDAVQACPDPRTFQVCARMAFGQYSTETRKSALLKKAGQRSGTDPSNEGNQGAVQAGSGDQIEGGSGISVDPEWGYSAWKSKPGEQLGTGANCMACDPFARRGLAAVGSMSQLLGGCPHPTMHGLVCSRHDKIMGELVPLLLRLAEGSKLHDLVIAAPPNEHIDKALKWARQMGLAGKVCFERLQHSDYTDAVLVFTLAGQRRVVWVEAGVGTDGRLAATMVAKEELQSNQIDCCPS